MNLKLKILLFFIDTISTLDGSCSYAGIRFPNYQTIPQELLPCHKRCICDTGMVRCRNICPDVPDEPPLGLPCPKSLTFRGHLPGDDCCIHWQCREQYNHDDKICKFFFISLH